MYIRGFVLTAAMVSALICGCNTKGFIKSHSYLPPKESCSDAGENKKEQAIYAEKPVIYLYGYEGKETEVTVDTNILKFTYPAATNGTWKINVDNNGNLISNSKSYRYLFWDGELEMEPSFKKGYCIRGLETQKFLEQKLDEFRFTAQEKQDFLTYWVPRMVDNEYNVISFQTTAYTSAAKLSVSPKPDRCIRIFMAWYPSDTYIEIAPQTLKIPERKGKVVVEWGGCEVQSAATQLPAMTDINITATGALPAQNPQVSQDPYAQYGVYAQCAKDWDSSSISTYSGKWATISEDLRNQAYYHWQKYGKAGW